MLTGTATVYQPGLPMLSGTATVDALASPYLTGTAEVDARVLTAWATPGRGTRTRVLLGEDGEDLRRIRGTVDVSVSGASPVSTATFRLKDSRTAYFNPGSIAVGGQLVEIRIRVRVPGSLADVQVFRGYTEACTNEGPFVPTGAIQAASEGAAWAAEKGCITLPAFSNLTSVEVLRAFADAAGLGDLEIRGGEGTRIIRLPLELSGLSPWTLGQRFAEIEGWYLRVVEGNVLELVPEKDVVGAEAEPIFRFHPGNYFSIREEAPNRPVTRLILSAVGIPAETFTEQPEDATVEIDGGVDVDGNRWETTKTTVTVNGVVIRETIEEYKTAAIPGVSPTAAAYRLWKRSRSTTAWKMVTVDGVALRTSQVESQRTIVEEWHSAPTAIGVGYEWSDGSRHADTAAIFQVTSDAVASYTYEAAPSCRLLTKTTRTGGWYAPLSAAGAFTYPDATKRTLSTFAWAAYDAAQPFSREVETYAEAEAPELHKVSQRVESFGWYVSATDETGIPTESWGLTKEVLTSWQTVPGSGVVSTATKTVLADGSITYHSSSAAGQLPSVPRAAADIPQFRTVPLVLSATAATSRHGEEVQTETVFDAESIEDLKRVARYRFRMETAPRVTILHPGVPQLLPWHPVTVHAPERGLVEKKGVHLGWRLTASALNGGLRQEALVAFPLPEFDPE